jgi:hypothetical protein
VDDFNATGQRYSRVRHHRALSSQFDDGQNALRKKILLKQSVKDRSCQVYGRILPLWFTGTETVKAVNALSANWTLRSGYSLP